MKRKGGVKLHPLFFADERRNWILLLPLWLSLLVISLDVLGREQWTHTHAHTPTHTQSWNLPPYSAQLRPK